MNAGNGVTVESLAVAHQTASGVVKALDGISFHIAAGTSSAIVGPSGCGKSTLLGLLGGLDVPTSGTVRVDATTISSLTDRDRAKYRRLHLGLVYQADNLLPFLTVAENITLQLALHNDRDGHGDSAIARTRTLLTRLGLESKADQLPDELSGGQRQRVAVARAIIHRPQLILADEPTGALDSANATLVVDLLLQVRAELGATLVMVTHDPDSAIRLDRVITLRDGSIVADSELSRVV